MIKPVTMYSVVCDRCGKPFIDEFNGIVAWLDEGTAKEQAMESEWVEIGDKHYCPDCYEFDDNSEKYVPVCVKTEYVDGENIKADTLYQLKNGKFVEVTK